MSTLFETKGYFLEYFIGNKYIGSKTIEAPDREKFGYFGRKTETLNEDIILANKKVIKKGTEINTMLQEISGKSAFQMGR